MAVLGVNFDLACFMAYCKTSCTLALVALPVFTGIPMIGEKNDTGLILLFFPPLLLSLKLQWRTFNCP